MGRPAIYTDATRVSVTGAKADSKLQERSERRAIVNVIIDNGGSLELGELDAHFGFDVRPSVLALIRSGWLEVVT